MNFRVDVTRPLQDGYEKPYSLRMTFNGLHWTVLELTREQLEKVQEEIKESLDD